MADLLHRIAAPLTPITRVVNRKHEQSQHREDEAPGHTRRNRRSRKPLSRTSEQATSKNETHLDVRV